MHHISSYYSRTAAVAAYKYYRKTWDRQVSLTLTKAHHSDDWIVRLAAAVTLSRFNIPFDGKE